MWRDVTESNVDPLNGRFNPDFNTPFGRQQRPRLLSGRQSGNNVEPTVQPIRMLTPGPPPTPSTEPRILPFVQSREIERLIFEQELAKVEETFVTLEQHERLKGHLVTALRMNEVMSRALRFELARRN